MTDLQFTSDRYVSSAFIDSSLKMGIAQSVLMIQDNLTECFSAMHCDGINYRENFNVFWVFTKSKVKFFRRPEWKEIITAKTFPIDNAGFKAHINTQIKDSQNNPILIANQEACVLDLEKHRPVKLSTLPYPKEEFLEPVFTQDFEKFECDYCEQDFCFEQKIRSQVIDMSHHMNNIEYIKLALNVFSDDFLQQNDVDTLEVHYLGESKENQILKVYSKQVEQAHYINIKEQDRSVFEMKIAFKN